MDQSQILKKMNGKQRLEQAFSLSDFTRELMIKNIMDTYGQKATKEFIREKVKERLNYK